MIHLIAETEECGVLGKSKDKKTICLVFLYCLFNTNMLQLEWKTIIKRRFIMAKTNSKNIYNYSEITPNTNLFNNEEINKQYSNVSSVLNNTPGTIQNNIFKTLPTTAVMEAAPSKEIDTQSLYDTIRSSYPTGSSYFSGGGGMIDISNMLKAFEQAAESNRNIATQSYETARNDLLTSLKRFQEQNARDVANQQRTYLSNQAAIENAIAQANRQNRISAAAKGLSGSGLQQLAQLQNLLSQGQTISDLANANQLTMDDLRRALTETEEDTDTKLANALKTYNNEISSINSNLALNKANFEAQARENAANRAASARNTAAQIDAQYDAQTRQDLNAFNASLSRYQTEYDEALSNAKKAKDIKAAADTYKEKVADLLEQYAIPNTNANYNRAYNYISSYLDDYNKQQLRDRINIWNWIIDPGSYYEAKQELRNYK